MKQGFFFASLFALIAVPTVTSAMTLDEYLQSVESKNKEFQSFQSSQQAASSRREQGDLQLSPVLTAKVRSVDDRKLTQFGNFFLDKTKGVEYSLGVAQKFSTGTSAELSGSMSNVGLYFPDGQGGEVVPRYSGALGVSLSQSLWKDGFGRSTDLRREREGLIEKTELEGIEVKRRQVLMQAEAVYWDYLYLREEVDQRQKSLDRARRIEAWVKRRAANGIGDRADLLNAQGLVAGRELQMMNAKDEFRAAEERLRTTLELSPAEKTPDLKSPLDKNRDIKKMVAVVNWTGRGPSSEAAVAGQDSARESNKVVQIDAYLALLEARVKSVVANEVDDSLSPDLAFEGAYKTNSFDPDQAAAISGLGRTNNPTTVVGLRFSMPLDGSLKDSARQAAKAEARAAALKQERKLMESDSAWSEFQRRHQEMSRRIEAAVKASQIQNEKAAVERDKLSKGRSITSQVIQAEQDAAEASLTVAKLRAEQRKMEAQARMFVQLKEAP